MDKLKIEYVDINNIKPYSKNAKRHTKKQIEQIKKSIEDFSFNDPIAIDENNVIIERTRSLWSFKTIKLYRNTLYKIKPFIRRAEKAYILVHNKLNMSTGFDDELLFDELNDILDIDMTDFGFDIDKIDLFKENERHKTNDAYNLDLIDFENSTNDFWQMPVIQNDNFIPDDIIGFNYAKSSKEHNVGIHFYLDDYQFERIWNKPEDYIDILKQYECIFSPDFSLYLDMPMPMKIWNIYRSRQIGQYYQSQGIKVIPTISWAEKETFEFAFKGIPKGSIVSISTIGVKRNKEALKIWQDGVSAMIEEIEPSTILVYGR